MRFSGFGRSLVFNGLETVRGCGCAEQLPVTVLFCCEESRAVPNANLGKSERDAGTFASLSAPSALPVPVL